MISTRLFDARKFTDWFVACVDPDNHVEWTERWAARGHEIEHFPVWADRVTKAVVDAARGQRRLRHEDHASMSWSWITRHPFTVHRWGCPHEGCGPKDGPRSSGWMIKPLRQRVVDQLRKDHGDHKIGVDGKQHRLANLNMEVPISVLADGDESWHDAIDRFRSGHNDDLRTIVRSESEREAKLAAGKL